MPSTVKTYKYSELRNHPRLNLKNNLIGEGILKENAVMVVGGPAKSFKSFITNTIALQLVGGTGHLFNAHRTEHGRVHPAFSIERSCRVLVFEQEIGEDDLEDRLNPMVDNLPKDTQQLIYENLYTHSMDHWLQLDVEAGQREIERIVSDIKPDVVVFDPLVEFHTLNENDTQGMAKVLRAMDYLRETYKPMAVIFNHHEGHQGQNVREGLDRLRGSTTIAGKCDTGLILKVYNRNALIIKCDFTVRRGKPIAPFFVKLNPFSLATEFLCWDTAQSRKGKLPKKDGEEEVSFYDKLDLKKVQ